MNKPIYITLFLILIFSNFTIITFTQNRITDNTSFPNFETFENKKFQIVDFQNWYDKHTNNTRFSYKIESETLDELGYKHIKINQYFDNYKIENAVYILHTKNNFIESVSGYLYSLKPKASSKQISIEKAKRKISKRKNISLANFELNSKYIENEEGSLVLCYEINIFNNKNSTHEIIYFNTETLQIEKIINQGHFIGIPTEVETNLSGKRTIITDFTNGVFSLLDSTRGKGIETLSIQNQTNNLSTKSIIDSTNTWNILKTKIERSALDVHFGATATYDYFLNKHNRNSIDDKGYRLTNIVNYGQNFVNAYWDGTKMVFGDGDNNIGPLVSLDIIGHEITHGLTSNTAKLLLENESGALNESFSDIFGIIIDFYTRPEKANWTIAEEVSPFIRSLQNPSLNNDPDTYHGTNWKPIGGPDFGGIHSNNGVQNHWFYLLTNGGKGINDNNDTFNIEGIGIEKAAQIVFRNLVYYLTPKSNFMNARISSIKATEDLYGSCSKEVENVTNAWYAVGVGEKYSSKIKSDFDALFTSNCDSLDVTFYNKTLNAKKFKWNFGDGTFSEEFEPKHKFNTVGNYNVKLIAIGDTICGIRDSITKIDFIQISKSEYLEKNMTHSACVLPSTFSPSITTDTLSTFNWYDTNKKLISTGSSFTFKSKEDSIIITEPNHYRVGNKYSNLNTSFYNYNIRYQVFDVYQPLIIESVEVNAQSTGERIFEIRDQFGKILQSKKIKIPAGISRVNLNFRIDPGLDLQFGIGGDLIGLSRSNTGINYPYTIPNLISIKRSNAQNAGYDFYYFFYDWDIKKINCLNEKFTTKLLIKEKTKLDTFKIIEENNKLKIKIDTNFFSVKWYNCLTNEKEFTEFGNIFIPTKNGSYSAIIIEKECNYSDSLECTFFKTQSIENIINTKFQINPNPFMESINILFNDQNQEEYLIVFSSLDGKILKNQILSNQKKINTLDLTTGIYFISIYNSKNDLIFNSKAIKL